MATLTIRNLPDETVERLKSIAKVHGRSMEQELRTLIESRYAPREAVLARIRGRWSSLPSVSDADVEDWINEGRS